MKIITLSIVIKTLFIRFYHKKVLHCWTSCNCNIILQYLEYAYQNQFTWYELLILHVSWFCWKCVKFHRTFLSCYVIDRMISVYLYIQYDILLNFLKGTDRIIVFIVIYLETISMFNSRNIHYQKRSFEHVSIMHHVAATIFLNFE